jgi:hypothetical protein
VDTPRQRQADFATPGHQTGEALSLDRRPDALSWDYRTAFAPGPRAVGDAGAGLLSRAWRATADDEGAVRLARANDAGNAWEAETVLFAYAGAPIVELGMAFEQNGRPVVCAERPTGAGGAPEVWLYWFKPVQAAFVFEPVAAGRTPRLLMDEPAAPYDSDVLLFYVSDAADRVEVRQQRDGYGVGLATSVTGVAQLRLEGAAKARSGAVQLRYSVRDPDTGGYALRIAETPPYPVRMETEGVTASAVPVAAALVQTTLAVDGGAEGVVPTAFPAQASVVDVLRDQVQPADDAVAVSHAPVSAQLVETTRQPALATEDAVTAVHQPLIATLTLVVLAAPDMAPEGVGAGIPTVMQATLESA